MLHIIAADRWQKPKVRRRPAGGKVANVLALRGWPSAACLRPQYFGNFFGSYG